MSLIVSRCLDAWSHSQLRHYTAISRSSLESPSPNAPVQSASQDPALAVYTSPVFLCIINSPPYTCSSHRKSHFIYSLNVSVVERVTPSRYCKCPNAGKFPFSSRLQNGHDPSCFGVLLPSSHSHPAHHHYTLIVLFVQYNQSSGNISLQYSIQHLHPPYQHI